MSADGIVVVGRVQGPYGIKGWVHLAVFTDPKDNLLRYRPWLTDGDGAGHGWQAADVREIRPHKQGFVARFEGVADRTAAEALKGRLIGVPETELSEPTADEFYWRDLIGTEVTDQQGACLGRVVELLETGAHDVLVIDPGTNGEQLLIPFHRQYVLDVDLAAGRIEVDWQVG